MKIRSQKRERIFFVEKKVEKSLLNKRNMYFWRTKK